MAFEPLQTDEKLEVPVVQKRDMDSAMLFGCSGFVFTSIAGYVLSVWPFLIFQNTDQIRPLAISAATGFLPAAIIGVIATRKFGLAGACGFVGGGLSTGIFLFLRIEQTFIAALARQGPTPEYPPLMKYLVPSGWIVISAILALIFLPKEREEEQ